ncbi:MULTISPECIES: hypothetical protein [unclassified Geodermatophilus]
MDTLTAPHPTTAPPRARRPLLAVLGLVLVVLGGLAGTAGAGVLAAFGTDGTVDTGPFRLSTSSAALVSEASRVDDVSRVAAVTGGLDLRLSVTGGDPSTPVFVGIGPAGDVEGYLAGVAHDEVSGLGTSTQAVDPQPGAPAAAPPGGQPFWAASADTASSGVLTWHLADGDHRLVVVNADGSPGVDARVDVQLVLDGAFPVGVALLVGGGVAALAGVVPLARAARR